MYAMYENCTLQSAYSQGAADSTANNIGVAHSAGKLHEAVTVYVSSAYQTVTGSRPSSYNTESSYVTMAAAASAG
eukprot:10644-Heterococcus_DN1.PRE.1